MTAAKRDLLDRHGINWLLATAIFVLGPLAAQVPLWLTGLSLLLIALRYFIARRGWPLPRRALRLALTLAFTAAVYLRYGTVFGRDAGIALLVGMLALKLLELRTLRDAALSVFILFFLTMGSFLFSQSFWLAGYLVLAVLLGIATLVRMSFPDGPSDRQAIRLSVDLLLKALPLALLLFVFFPRIEGTLWALPTDAHAARAGMSDSMSPGSINELVQSDAVAFRVSFRGVRPPAQQLYWRGLVLWDTNGQSWTRGRVATVGARGLVRGKAPVRYSITLEPTNEPWLVALDWPARAPPGALVSAGDVLSYAQPVSQRVRYSVTSVLRPRAAALSAFARARALALPHSTSARVITLAQHWRAQATDDTAIVNDALDFFRRNDFVYTLTPPLLGADPVDEFLFDTRSGFCEHYAAAFVTLMRAAGIPSRVVIGYQGGEYNPAGDYLIVRQSDAHAWAEVWLAGRGWVRVDPTAAVAPERIQYGEDALLRLFKSGTPLYRLTPGMLRRALALGWMQRLRRNASLAWDTVNNTWYEWVLDYDKARQARVLKHLGVSHWALAVLALAVMGAGALFLLVYALALKPRPDLDEAQRAYRRFCRKLARVGLRRAPWEGPVAFAQRAGLARPDLHAAIEGITRAYVQIRYGSAGSAALKDLWRQVRALRLHGARKLAD